MIKLKFEAGNNVKYKVEAIQNSTVNAKESKTGHLPELYYLIFWKSYFKEENT